MRVAIIGSGFGLYGLLPAFNAIKGCEVVETVKIITSTLLMSVTVLYKNMQI
jgi:hypothetical protein